MVLYTAPSSIGQYVGKQYTTSSDFGRAESFGRRIFVRSSKPRERALSVTEGWMQQKDKLMLKRVITQDFCSYEAQISRAYSIVRDRRLRERCNEVTG